MSASFQEIHVRNTRRFVDKRISDAMCLLSSVADGLRELGAPELADAARRLRRDVGRLEARVKKDLEAEPK